MKKPSITTLSEQIAAGTQFTRFNESYKVMKKESSKNRVLVKNKKTGNIYYVQKANAEKHDTVDPNSPEAKQAAQDDGNASPESNTKVAGIMPGKGNAKIDFDFVGDKGAIETAKNDYNVTVNIRQGHEADLSGSKTDILRYLSSDAYGMDPIDIEELFPELQQDSDGASDDTKSGDSDSSNKNSDANPGNDVSNTSDVNPNNDTNTKLKAGTGNAKIYAGWVADSEKEEKAAIKVAKKKYNVVVKIDQNSTHGDADLIGSKADILRYMASDDYRMDDRDIEDLYPELLDKSSNDGDDKNGNDADGKEHPFQLPNSAKDEAEKQFNIKITPTEFGSKVSGSDKDVKAFLKDRDDAKKKRDAYWNKQNESYSKMSTILEDILK